MLTFDTAYLLQNIYTNSTYPGYYFERLYGITADGYRTLIESFVYEDIKESEFHLIDQATYSYCLEIFKYLLKTDISEEQMDSYYDYIWHGDEHIVKWALKYLPVPKNILPYHMETVKIYKNIDDIVFKTSAVCGYINVVEWIYENYPYRIDHNLLIDIACGDVMHMVKWVYKKHPELFDDEVMGCIMKHINSY